MDFLDLKKDFDWVVKVLESCISKEQIQVTDNLLDNFISKWNDYLFEERKIMFHSTYTKIKQKKLMLLK